MVTENKFGLSEYKALSFKTTNTDNEQKTTISCVMTAQPDFDIGKIARKKNKALRPTKTVLYVGQEVDAEHQLFKNIPSILDTWHSQIVWLKNHRVAPSEVIAYDYKADEEYTVTFYDVFSTMVEFVEIEQDTFAYVSTEIADYTHAWIKTHPGYQYAQEFYSFMLKYGIGYSQAKNVAEKKKAIAKAENNRTTTDGVKYQSRGRGRPAGWRKAKSILKTIGTIGEGN